MSNTEKLKQMRSELEAVWPDLSIFEVAKLTLDALNSDSVAVNTKVVKVPTISEVIEQLRERLLQVELERPRAKISPDGSIKLKDTTTYRTYQTNWVRLEKLHGQMPIDQLTEELALKFCSDAMKLAKKTHLINAKSREARGLSVKDETGHHSYNRALDTLSTIVKYGVKKGVIKDSPLADIKRKPLSETNRHGLTPEQVEEILSVALRGGNDPELDYTMLWTIVETACRSGGILKLQLQDLDSKEMMIRLHEKGGKSRKQPVSKALMESILKLAKSRGASKPTDAIFCYKTKCDCNSSTKSGCACKSHPHAACSAFSVPVSAHRFEKLWRRIGEQIPWVAEEQVSNHWLRHSTLTWVERATSSNSIASKYAGHGPGTVTEGYTRARKEEIKQVHKGLFDS